MVSDGCSSWMRELPIETESAEPPVSDVLLPLTR
jgi:hypothetical protein